jgi:hypothetical protein
MAQGDPNPFDEIEADLGPVLRDVAEEMLARVQDRISVDVERVGSRVIRSKPGEHPRRDTGNLYASFIVEENTENHTVAAAVTTDVEYAVYLQLGMDRPITDAGPDGPALLDEYEPLVIDRIAGVIERR